jgi:hypothetical protein
MNILYLAKEPDQGVMDDLEQFKDHNVTICACLPGYVDYYKHLGYNVVTRESVTMDFDAIVGNPPYQRNREIRNIGAPLWPDFLEFAVNHITDDGVVQLVIPATWLKRLNGKAWNIIKSNNLVYCDPDVKWAFPHAGGNGGTFSVIHLKRGPYQGHTSIRGEFDIDIINDLIPTNNRMFTKENIEFIRSFRPIELDVHFGPTNPSINSNHYNDTQTDTHKHNVYYSGASNRRSIWCDQPVGHCGQLKLVVPNSGNFYDNMEITTKGAGRQTSYVLGTQEELESIRDRMLSDDSIRLNSLMSEGNYNYPLKWVV